MAIGIRVDLQLIDVVNLTIGVAWQIRTQIEHQDDLQFGFRRVLHPADQRIDDLRRSEVLVLNVDVALGIVDRPLVGFENAGFAVWKILIAWIVCLERLARQRAQYLDGCSVRPLFRINLRRDHRQRVVRGSPDCCEGFINVCDGGSLYLDVAIMVQRTLVPGVIDEVMFIAEIELLQGRSHQDRFRSVHGDCLGVENRKSLRNALVLTPGF